MSEPARVLVVQNARSGGLGRFEPWWQEAGLAITTVHAYAGEPIPDLDGHDGLALLGGGLMPDDDHRAGWLPREREITAAAVDSGRPLLGICLGGQLLAHVAGGTVRAEHGLPEAGSTTLTRRAEADDDPLFGPLPDEFLATENHVDQITELPADAAWLAHSERCPVQAFRVGDLAWGMQFHPEVDADRIRAWDPDRLAAKGFDHDEVVREAESTEPHTEPVWRAFAERFASLVQQQSPH